MTSETTTETARPRFSIVSAVYNVARYLPDFIASVEAQRVAPGELEIIAVDDGSTDDSLDVLRAWASRSRHQVRVLTKENGGQGSARNLGLEHATGQWVGFNDPDDMFGRDYFRAAGRFADAHPDVRVLSARVQILWEATGRRSDKHPRKWQYVTTRVADLVDEPSVFLAASPGTLFRHDLIRELELRFDVRIRPNFEDAHFAVRYLLAAPRPLIGLLRDMVYVYRKRADGSSTLQGSMRQPGRYGAVLELGYLDVLERSAGPGGRAAPWVQQLIVYELSWYLGADEQITSPIEIPPGAEARFHELWATVVRRLDPGVVAQHRGRKLPPHWLDILAHGYRDKSWRGPARVDKQDRAMGLQRVRYAFTGPQPLVEQLEVAGQPAVPAFAKTRTYRVFGLPVLHERLFWLTAGGRLRVVVDGQALPVERGKPGSTHGRWRGVFARLRRIRPDTLRSGVIRRSRRIASKGRSAALRRLASLPRYRSSFGQAWVLMDRVHNADDNAERLFEHLRAHRPDINAWFVMAPDAADWPRLRKAHGARLVAWGSLRWRLLLLNAAWLVSSHADRAVVAPRRIVRKEADRPWRFAFLQHGVIKDDLSLWLNRREIELFVVSTVAELESVAGDGTGYEVTRKETRLTGLPRFDRLQSLAASTPEDERRLVIVAPTWRQSLTLASDPDTQHRAIDESYWASDYHAAWMGILRSTEIAEAVRARGLQLAFMPHPNLQSILAQLDLPAHVQPLGFDGVDVQALYARTALLVTDYSSVAFNIAYIDRPVVYFQFDRQEMERGAHVGRKGYFDYGRDGFGPVADDLPAAEAAIVAAIRQGPHPAAEYQARIEAAFRDRDGQACVRVVAAIEELSRPWPG